MDEVENICNMPELFRIDGHRSEQTGTPYICFISWIGLTPAGRWTDIQVTNEEIDELFGILKKGKILDD